MSEIFTGSVVDKAQADGAQVISLGADDKYREHQIQLEVSAVPDAGSLDVAIKTPGATAFKTIETIDMTDINDHLKQFKYYASQIQFTPTGFDAAKTYSVYMASGAGT